MIYSILNGKAPLTIFPRGLTDVLHRQNESREASTRDGMTGSFSFRELQKGFKMEFRQILLHVIFLC